MARSDTTLAGVRDLVAIWRATHDRIVDLIAGRPASCAEEPVPTLAGVVVRDVLRHLVQSAECVALGGDMTATLRHPVPRDDPTTPVSELIVSWTSAISDAIVRDSDEAVISLLVTDAAMSEQDLRTAFAAPGARDDVAVKVALDELSGRFSDRVAAARLPPLRVTVEQWGTVIGDGRARACVVADRFEFVRAMSGRRSATEVSRWNWSDDPAPYLAMVAEHGLPLDEVRERDPRVPAHMRDREFSL